MRCRFCNEKLRHEFVDLINSPPSNSFLTADELDEPEVYYPLRLFVCDNCRLVQVAEYKKSSEIFNSKYVYFSSFSRSWLEHCEKYAFEMTERFNLSKESRVIEVASNDGYLLQYFQAKNIPVLGIEPTKNTAAKAQEKGIETVVDFFGRRLATELKTKGIAADLLAGNNVLAHVPDINDFVGGLEILLKPDGVITMEFPHLLSLVAHAQFDTIYHEHFSYLSFFTTKKIFEAAGLSLFDVEEIPTHGGSLRIYARKSADKSKPISPRVAALEAKEAASGISTDAYYNGFQERTDTVKRQFLEFLIGAKKAGKSVSAYGAAAKGNTLLNYCGIRRDLLPYVVDASPHKRGLYLPGSHIPVVEEARIKESKPDYVVILPWNLETEIAAQLSYIREWQGKFVIPLPELRIF